jgi:hypothetical protein
MWYRFVASLVIIVMSPAVGWTAEGSQWNFEAATEGTLPEGWTAFKTGEGPGSIWKVVTTDRDGKKNQALAQTSSEGTNSLFNLCVVKDVKQADIDLSADVKAISGDNDRGGGLLWRYHDAGNYYVTRWNPLEDNFRVYHVVNGKRTQLANADVKLPSDKWHTIRAVQRGNHIQCYLDDNLLLDVMDGTIQDAGAVGLWSKADAVTWFDNVVLKTPQKE